MRHARIDWWIDHTIGGLIHQSMRRPGRSHFYCPTRARRREQTGRAERGPCGRSRPSRVVQSAGERGHL